MKAICRSNRLSELLLTGVHREQLELMFPAGAEPSWEAQPGRLYSVYALKIIRGCPFYFVQRTSRWPDELLWGYIPSLCFEIIDDRPSSHWRFSSKVIEFATGWGRNEIIVTRLEPELFREPHFLSNLVGMRKEDVAAMTTLAASMDVEFS